MSLVIDFVAALSLVSLFIWSYKRNLDCRGVGGVPGTVACRFFFDSLSPLFGHTL